MKRVTGIGGVFFKCEDPTATKAWYEKHLGIPAGNWGHAFDWKDGGGDTGTTAWNTFSAKSTHFGPGDQQFMVNYRVADLTALFEALRSEGVEIAGEMQEFEYGKFGWIVDCDGRRVELWEPANEEVLTSEG